MASQWWVAETVGVDMMGSMLEAAMIGVATVEAMGEESAGAWMEEAVMGVEAIESRAAVVLVAAAAEQGATVKE